ncbi:cyclic nucleotide-binding protein [Pedobacter cryoconitis]|uniref:Cyclic nucleotide-binding protein n=1 Tax=Pedobacter cryoconitis TaxID=188932 RepID=A0A127VEK0_9SPHI|nr:Crp/Fnr family transcriptional regulator [Pedobacter cryoconitis]AMP99667.1 cyclic nucleotide-binding protein [Pedobacter cryoconitis]
MDENKFGQLRKYLTNHIHVNDEMFSAFCSKFKFKTFQRNEILLKAGDICSHMYFVKSGCLRIFMLDAEGKESTRFLVFEDKFGTAFPSFTLQEPSLAFIQSLETSKVLYISYRDFQQLLNDYPEWERVYRINLEKDYIDSIKRIESLITVGAKDRYKLLISNNQTLIKRLSSKIVADYLGISQETLSRLKSKK